MPTVETRPYGPGRRAAIITTPLHNLSAEQADTMRQRITGALPGTDVLLIDRSGTVHAQLLPEAHTP